MKFQNEAALIRDCGPSLLSRFPIISKLASDKRAYSWVVEKKYIDSFKHAK